jgi:hypothetical protein
MMNAKSKMKIFDAEGIIELNTGSHVLKISLSPAAIPGG